MSHVKYELGFYIPKDDILHTDRRDNLRSYVTPISVAVFCSYACPSVDKDCLNYPNG
jgi:hypothetical protein